MRLSSPRGPAPLGHISACVAMLVHVCGPAAIGSADGGAPRLDLYPCQTAIEGRPFHGPPPGLSVDADPVTWSLTDGPQGMTVEPRTGAPLWPQPVRGRHFATLSVMNAVGHDEVEWALVVVNDDIPNARIVSTDYLDFVVPAAQAAWMERWGFAAHADACWEQMRDVIGQEPLDGKQVVKYNPSEGGGAHSGNPVEAGPLWWPLDPVGGWAAGAWVHEVGHNFHGLTRMGEIIKGNWADAFFHHGMLFTQLSVAIRAIEAPEAFALSPVSFEAYSAHVHQAQREDHRRCRSYEAWLASGGRAANYRGDHFGGWAGICQDLCVRFGPSVFEKTLRALRCDGLPAQIYAQARTPVQKNTLLFCLLSLAAGEDLRPFFRTWGFEVDDACFEAVRPAVSATMADLPDEDVDGWKLSPINAHYHRLTPWPMHWQMAERTAQRYGGHLVTVRAQDENDWLVSRFGIRGALWVGATDREREGRWQWTSGEAFTYANWGPGEPNGQARESFVALNWDRESGRWNDADSRPRLYGIIEAPALPPSASQQPRASTCQIPLAIEAALEESFEQTRGAGPPGWTTITWRGKGVFDQAARGHTGARSVTIASVSGTDAAITRTVPVRPHSLYRLSGWIRTEGVDTAEGGNGALINVHNVPGAQTGALAGTHDWTYAVTVFNTRDQRSAQINCALGGWGLAKGQAWFDDVALVLLSSVQVQPLDSR